MSNKFIYSNDYSIEGIGNYWVDGTCLILFDEYYGY
jgi:hypothetical protein